MEASERPQRTNPFISPPDCYEGFVQEFIELIVVPNWPAADHLLAWAEALLGYSVSSDPIHIVREGPRGVHLALAELSANLGYA